MNDSSTSSSAHSIKIIKGGGKHLLKKWKNKAVEPFDPDEIFSPNFAEHPVKKNKKKKRKKKEKLESKIKFNQSKFPAEYNSWKNAKSRCRNPKPKDMKYLKVVFSKRFEKFSDFMVHIGPKPKPTYSLDRIDNNRGYVPGNIRWASKSEQAANRSPTIFIEHAGELKPLRIWAEIYGLSLSTLYGRYNRGDRHPEALFRDTKDSRKISRPRKKHHSPIPATPDITTPYVLTEEDTVAAIGDYNRLRGEPAELTLVRDTSRNRRRFFKTANKIEKIAKEIEREAKEKRGRSALREKEKLEKAEKEWNDKIKFLRVSVSDKAKAWRRANGVSEDESIKDQENHERMLEEGDRDERIYKLGKLLTAAENIINKKMRIDIDLQDIILTLINHVPDLEKHIPPELVEAIKCVDRGKTYKPTLSLDWKPDAIAEKSITNRHKDSHYGGFSSLEEYEEYKDAAIGQGEWCEEDLDEEDRDEDEVEMYGEM